MTGRGRCSDLSVSRAERAIRKKRRLTAVFDMNLHRVAVRVPLMVTAPPCEDANRVMNIARRDRAQNGCSTHQSLQNASRNHDAGAAQTCPYRARRETTYSMAILQREALEVQRAVDPEKSRTPAAIQHLRARRARDRDRVSGVSGPTVGPYVYPHREGHAGHHGN